jgi:hypothetical protein
MNVCRFCGEFFASEFSLRQHEAPTNVIYVVKWLFRSTITKHTCSVIPLNASTNVQIVQDSHDLKRHAQRKSQTNEFKCDECGLAFSNNKILNVTKISKRIENVINVESVAKHSGIIAIFTDTPNARKE